MSLEHGDAITCEECPLNQLGDAAMAEAARQWAFNPPLAYEGSQDPRYPNLSLMAKHFGSLCLFRNNTGLCKQPAPEIAPPSDEM